MRVGNQVGKAGMYSTWSTTGCVMSQEPQFPGWECGSRVVGRVGRSGAGCRPVSDQLARDLAKQAVRLHLLQGRAPQGWGGQLAFPASQQSGSGPHPALFGGLLLGPSHSFICSFILRIHPAPAVWAPTWGRDGAERCESPSALWRVGRFTLDP